LHARLSSHGAASLHLSAKQPSGSPVVLEVDVLDEPVPMVLDELVPPVVAGALVLESPVVGEAVPVLVDEPLVWSSPVVDSVAPGRPGSGPQAARRMRER
jgi:hypothetical protein